MKSRRCFVIGLTIPGILLSVLVELLQAGNSPQYSHLKRVTQTPTVALKALPQQGNAPLSVTLYASPLSDSMPQNYTIDFGDGKSASIMSYLEIGCTRSIPGSCFSSYTISIDHIYSTPGSYTATLSSTEGIIGKITIFVEVNSSSFFKASVTEGVAPLSVTFSTFNYGGSLSRIVFGDGEETFVEGYTNSKNPIEVTHVYTSPGIYIAKFYPTHYDNITITVKNRQN